MLVKFFGSRGGGSPKASVDYLLGKDRAREGARVLSGDPELSLAIADNIERKQKYTVGCLSFEEENIPEAQKIELMQKFEEMIFAGLEPEQYNVLWVEHTDKDRLELNFFIPKTELTTGKRLEPYFDRKDRPLVDSFARTINADYGFTDPHDPDKKRALQVDKTTPKELVKTKVGITEAVAELVQAGKIRSQADVIDFFKTAELEIARSNPNSISIKNPDGKANIRFRGEYFSEEFYEQVKNIESGHTRTSADSERDRVTEAQSVIERARTTLTERTKQRAEYHRQFYERIKEPKRSNQKAISSEKLDSRDHNGLHTVRNRRDGGDVLVGDRQDKQPTERVYTLEHEQSELNRSRTPDSRGQNRGVGGQGEDVLDKQKPTRPDPKGGEKIPRMGVLTHENESRLRQFFKRIRKHIDRAKRAVGTLTERITSGAADKQRADELMRKTAETDNRVAYFDGKTELTERHIASTKRSIDKTDSQADELFRRAKSFIVLKKSAEAIQRQRAEERERAAQQSLKERFKSELEATKRSKPTLTPTEKEKPPRIEREESRGMSR